ncbi:MAG TPA: hypothetical protein VH020_14490 [Stellaceae bacterium]|jgi:hypothetical protein|nr:hypothetical protein [Stellaceae bacterium]
MRIQGFLAGFALVAAIAVTSALGAMAVADVSHYPMATGMTAQPLQNFQHSVVPQYPLQPILGQ